MSEILIGVSDKDGQPSITVNGIPVSPITASAVGAAMLAIGRELSDVEQMETPRLGDLAPAFMQARRDDPNAARPRTL